MLNAAVAVIVSNLVIKLWESVTTMEQNFDDYLNSDEFIADSKAAQLAMEAHDKLELTRFNRIMKKLKKRLSACWFEQLKSYIEDSGFTFNFEIVNKPIGDKENQELRFKVYAIIKKELINRVSCG